MKQHFLFAVGIVLILIAVALAAKQMMAPKNWTTSDNVWVGSIPDPPETLGGETRMTLDEAKQKCLAVKTCGGFRRKETPAVDDATAKLAQTQFFGKKISKESPNRDWTNWYRPGVRPDNIKR